MTPPKKGLFLPKIGHYTNFFEVLPKKVTTQQNSDNFEQPPTKIKLLPQKIKKWQLFIYLLSKMSLIWHYGRYVF